MDRQQGWMQAEWPQPTAKLVQQFSKAFLSLLFSATVDANSTSTLTQEFPVPLHQRTASHCQPHCSFPCSSAHRISPQPLLIWTGAPNPTYWPLPAPSLSLLLPVLNVNRWPGYSRTYWFVLPVLCSVLKSYLSKTSLHELTLDASTSDTRQLQHK